MYDSRAGKRPFSLPSWNPMDVFARTSPGELRAPVPVRLKLAAIGVGLCAGLPLGLSIDADSSSSSGVGRLRCFRKLLFGSNLNDSPRSIKPPPISFFPTLASMIEASVICEGREREVF